MQPRKRKTPFVQTPALHRRKVRPCDQVIESSILLALHAVSLFLILTPMSYGRELETTKGGFHRSINWTASDMSRAQGLQLYLLDFQCCIAERILLAPSEGEAMLLDHAIDLETGEQRVRLEDSSGIWWLEVVDQHEIRAENTHQFFQFLLGGYREAKKPSFTRRIFSSEGQVWTAEISYGKKDWQVQMLEQLQAPDSQARHIDAPPAAHSIALMFRSILESELDLARGFGSIGAPLFELILALDPAGRVTKGFPLTWTLEEPGKKVWALSISDPELLELMSEFPNLDNVDPFQGMLGLNGIESPR